MTMIVFMPNFIVGIKFSDGETFKKDGFWFILPCKRIASGSSFIKATLVKCMINVYPWTLFAYLESLKEKWVHWIFLKDFKNFPDMHYFVLVCHKIPLRYKYMYSR